MTAPIAISFAETDLDALKEAGGKLAVLVTPEGKLDPAGRRLNRLTRGALARLVESDRWGKVKIGEGVSIGYPTGLEATALMVLSLPRRPSAEEARKAGATLAKFKGSDPLTVAAGATARVADLSLGLALRGYDFTTHKTAEAEVSAPATILVTKPEEVAAEAKPMMALAEGVFFTRDLVNEPSNVLTTSDFAARLAAMQDLGLEVEILEEEDLARLGMGALLGVGQGSDSPSKVVVMQWNGGETGAPPLALIGKGVVFDTGGISLKPAGGMEDMTMDMGGGGGGGRRGCHARAGAARGQGQCRGAGRAGREHARPECAAPRRRGEVDEGRHDRGGGGGDQYRRRGAFGAGRRDVVRAGPLQARWE